MKPSSRYYRKPFLSKLSSMSEYRFQATLQFSLLLLATIVFLALPVSSAVSQRPEQPARRPGVRPAPGARVLPGRPPAKRAPGKAKGRPAGPQANARGEELGPPAPETVVLATSDAVKLTATYFKPTTADGEKAKAIPFILIHDWESDRTQLLEYGAFLQSAGHAVIVPDLRGHGKSTAVEGLDRQIDAKNFRKKEIASMVKDIERCKKYLVKRNNEGEVNIDMLSVVAVGKSSVLAVQWIINDWYAFPAFDGNGTKQGEDVKTLILVSPRKKLKGLSLVANWKDELFTGAKGNGLPMMIIWGSRDEDAAKDSESLYDLAKRSRPDPKKIEDPEKRKEATTLKGVPIRGNGNSSTGAQLMSQPEMKKLWEFTERFVSEKIEANADSLPWKSRAKDDN